MAAQGRFTPPQVITVPLDAVLNLADYVVDPGVEVWSIYFPDGPPPGVTVQMSWGQRAPFTIREGDSFRFDVGGSCVCPMDAGISFGTAVASPGNSFTMVLGVDDSGVGVNS